MSKILLIATDSYVARASVALGLETVIVRNVSAMTHAQIVLPQEARVIYVRDSSSVQDIVLALASTGLSVHDFDAIQTSNEFSLIAACALSEIAGLPGPSLRVAVAMRNKYAQNSLIVGAGIPAARTRAIARVDDLGRLSDLSEPFVVKPAAGASASETKIFDNAEAAREYVIERAESGIVVPALVCQERVFGDEFMIDGVVTGGEVQFASMALCQSNWISVVDSDSVVETYRVRDQEHPGLRERATGFAHQVMRALGHSDGIFHLEGFMQADGTLVFGECGARRGGVLVQEEVLEQHGVSLARAGLEIALAKSPVVRERESADLVGTTYLTFSRGGVVADLPTRESLMALPGVKFVKFDTHIGEVIDTDRENASQRAAMALISAPDVKNLRSRFALVREVFARTAVVVPNKNALVSAEYQRSIGRQDLNDLLFRE